ncbi:MAG: malto-oligosyltrehalose trehalohydrolase [Elusimicrobia bacterium HGW-Elusimicrobia-3]|nr:MAG: malto-oligosyltrehalose trehalohydrolase [Elusimicrobia bacterium HGW-Elusimicrobia-3]
MTPGTPQPCGAFPEGEGTFFRVWAPRAASVELRLGDSPGPGLKMKNTGGYWEAYSRRAGQGTLYTYSVDGGEPRPDPASRSQPLGVHGPSEVVDQAAFAWQDGAWKGLPQEQLIIYELHPGTFTREGGFAGVEARLDYLKALGVTALELMPVAQFPGERNWGYDGVYPYAPQASYGGPAGLKRLVNACHKAGLAVVLDVVYNHLGPEGNYLDAFGPYFTDHYRTPWGRAVNFDGADSVPVREFFIGNALYWLRDFHVDALRLDAVHGIYDLGARHFLTELADRTRALAAERGRELLLIAESDLNDPRLIRPEEEGGYGLHAQWSDDFHHALHSLLTGERQGYYEDFGGFQALVKACSEAFVYDWAWSPHRRRMHGAPAGGLPPARFVVSSQNHDQVGNRLLGERLTALTTPKRLRLAAGAVLLSPYVPLLFMGEEYGETNPFLYFVSHGDEALVAAVREGRKKEFAAFGWKQEPPDPQAAETFERSRLDWSKPGVGRHAETLDFYRRLIALRRAEPSLGPVGRQDLVVRANPENRTLSLFRRKGRSSTYTAFNFGRRAAARTLPPGRWAQIFSSEGGAAPRHAPAAAALPPESFKVFRRTDL